MTPNPDPPSKSPGPAETIARFQARSGDVAPSDRELFDYADALRRVGRGHDALKIYGTLEGKGFPDQWQSLVVLFKGQTFREMGRYAEAEGAFRTACELDGSTVPRVYLAGALAAQERFAEAAKVLEDAADLPGDPDEVLLNLALNQRTLGLLVEAQESLQQALLLTPDYPEATALLADVRAALAWR